MPERVGADQIDRNPLPLQQSLLKRVHPGRNVEHQTLFCAELFRQMATLTDSNSPVKQARRKRKGRHSAEVKFPFTQGALERIDEESMHHAAASVQSKQLIPQRHSFSDFSSIETIKRESLRVRRSRLEKDIVTLHTRLQDELNLHEALENALSGELSQHLPLKTRKVLADIAMLEVAVLKLEQQVNESRWQLLQERKDRSVLEQVVFDSQSEAPEGYLLREELDPHFHEINREAAASDQLPGECYPHSSDAESIDHEEPCSSSRGEQQLCSICTGQHDCRCESPPKPWRHKMKTRQKQEELFEKLETPQDQMRITKQSAPEKLCPNKLSEEMLECMIDIYIHLSEHGLSPSTPSSLTHVSSPTSPFTHLTTSSMSSLSETSSSPVIELQDKENVLGSDSLFDPYRAREKLSWVDIGTYGSAREIRWISVAKDQLGYAADALRSYKLLVEQLASINVASLTHTQKLAFWINIYNSLLMHTYLAYGTPKSELNAFSLMQKASYVIGGHVLSALSIEYQMLRHRPPTHRPQMALLLALHKVKLTPERNELAIDAPEPLTLFGLACGARSSPLVRVYTADSVQHQLRAALHDYVRASVGLSVRGKLLLPKLLHSYARGSMDDAGLVHWLLLHLPSSQVSIIQDCLHRRGHRFLSSRSLFSVLPFDSSFQYLILPPSRNRLHSSCL